MRRSLLLFALLTLPLLGCAPTLTDARAAIDGAARAYAQIEPNAVKLYDTIETGCLDRPEPPSHAICVTEVQTSWKPVRAALNTFFHELVLAQNVVGVAEASAKVGRAPDLATLMLLVVRLVDAWSAAGQALSTLQHQGGAR